MEMQAVRLAEDAAHNAAILAAIPATDPVLPNDPLSQAVSKFGNSVTVKTEMVWP